MGGVAGCSAGGGDESTETDQQTATADAATATRTATATTTATPSAAVREADEAIAAVQNTFDAIVRQYAGSGSDDILDMTVTTEFNSTLIDRSIEEAGEEIERARELAVTDAQVETVERLTVAHHFFDLAADIQSTLTAASFDLTNARRELDQEEPSDARDAVSGIGTETTIGRKVFTQLQAETTADAVAVVNRLDAATYEAKVAQFDAELGGLGRLRIRLDEFTDSINYLLQARKEAERGEDPTESANQAIERLVAVADRLEGFADGLSEAGAALEPVGRGFVTLAERKAEAARTIRDEN